MENLPLTIIDTKALATEHQAGYFNAILSNLNDHVVRMSVMTEAYFWHLHPNSDETFLVLEGIIFIELEAETIELQAGQLFTIPKNIRHRTRPKGERSVNLTIEHRDMETIKG